MVKNPKSEIQQLLTPNCSLYVPYALRARNTNRYAMSVPDTLRASLAANGTRCANTAHCSLKLWELLKRQVLWRLFVIKQLIASIYNFI